VGHEPGYFSAGSGRAEGLTFIKGEQRYFYMIAARFLPMAAVGLP
jgi:hypothetical protein